MITIKELIKKVSLKLADDSILLPPSGFSWKDKHIRKVNFNKEELILSYYKDKKKYTGIFKFKSPNDLDRLKKEISKIDFNKNVSLLNSYLNLKDTVLKEMPIPTISLKPISI